MEKGIAESFVFILDCKGIGWWNTPFLECKRVANVLINIFKAKVQRIYCLNCEMTFGLVWSTVKLMMDAQTIEKVEHTWNFTCKGIKSSIHPAQLEMKYDGDEEDLDIFWPPKLRSSKFGIDKKRLAPTN